MLHYLQKYYMLYVTICTYNITFLIVVMVIITVCYLLGTLLEGVEVCRFNKCTKFLAYYVELRKSKAYEKSNIITFVLTPSCNEPAIS
jgi:uncharacterized membrane protein required for colicin V production